MSIKLADATFTYMKGTPLAHTALKDLNLEIQQGEFVALVGHTGSGKSTLVQLMNGLLQPMTGSVCIDDIDLSIKGQIVKDTRKKVGIVFQYPEQQLFAETVYEDVAFAPRNKGMTADEVDKAVRSALRFVGLDFEKFQGRNPLHLSGGQMRRVAIAGVVAMQPDYLILDEPSAGLDPKGCKELFKSILSLHKEKGIGIILVTHNMEEAAMYAKRILVMDKGQIVFDGTPQQLFVERREQLLMWGMDEPELYKLTNMLQKCGLQLTEIRDINTLVSGIKKAKGWR